MELFFQVLEFLIGEGLDRRRIKDAHPFGQGVIDLVFPYKGLSRSRLGTDENMLFFGNGADRMLLKGIQWEGVRVRRKRRRNREIGLDQKGRHGN